MKRVKRKTEKSIIFNEVSDFLLSEPVVERKLESEGVHIQVTNADIKSGQIVLQWPGEWISHSGGLRFGLHHFSTENVDLAKDIQCAPGEDNVIPFFSSFFSPDLNSSQHGSVVNGLFFRAKCDISANTKISYDFETDANDRACTTWVNILLTYLGTIPDSVGTNTKQFPFFKHSSHRCRALTGKCRFLLTLLSGTPLTARRRSPPKKLQTAHRQLNLALYHPPVLQGRNHQALCYSKKPRSESIFLLMMRPWKVDQTTHLT